MNVLPPNGRLRVAISVIADCIAIISFLTTIVKQDLLLGPSMVVVLLAGGLVVRSLFRNPVKIPPPPWPTIILIISLALVTVALATVAYSMLAGSGVTPLEVDITDPQNGGSVTWQYRVMGTVDAPNARVYVVVRTIPMSNMWVQQPAFADKYGDWSATVFFGDKTISAPESYEAIALATNDNFLVTCLTGNSLSEGQELSRLPPKSNRSNRVTVTRLE